MKIWDVKKDVVDEYFRNGGGGGGGSGRMVSSTSNNGRTKERHVYDEKWDVATNSVETLLGHEQGVNDIAWSNDGQYLASASDDKTLRLYDVTTGSAVVEFQGHTNFVFCLAFNPQSNLICSGSFDEHVKLWDVRSGDCVSTLPAHSDPVTGVDFNRDGSCIVSGSHDGLIRIWDTATSECLKTIYAEGNPAVSFVKFAPNGKYILAGTLDSALRLWNVGSIGKCSKTYRGHTNTKFCCFSAYNVFNQGYQTVVTGSEDGNIHIYDLQGKTTSQVLRGHKDSVLAVDASKNSELIASGGMSNDRTVKFWAPRSIVRWDADEKVEGEGENGGNMLVDDGSE